MSKKVNQLCILFVKKKWKILVFKNGDIPCKSSYRKFDQEKNPRFHFHFYRFLLEFFPNLFFQ